jgi:hypothetical protein
MKTAFPHLLSAVVGLFPASLSLRAEKLDPATADPSQHAPQVRTFL